MHCVTVWHSEPQYFTGSHLGYSYQARPGQAVTASQLGFISSQLWSGLVWSPPQQTVDICLFVSPHLQHKSGSCLVFGWAGHNTERERESPVWVCALLVEPDQGRPGHWAVSHCDFVRKYWQQTFLYPPVLLPSCSAALLLQLLSIIGQTVSVRLLSPHWDQEKVTKPPAVESREDNWLTNCNTGKHYIS